MVHGDGEVDTKQSVIRAGKWLLTIPYIHFYFRLTFKTLYRLNKISNVCKYSRHIGWHLFVGQTCVLTNWQKIQNTSSLSHFYSCENSTENCHVLVRDIFKFKYVFTALKIFWVLESKYLWRFEDDEFDLISINRLVWVGNVQEEVFFMVFLK